MKTDVHLMASFTATYLRKPKRTLLNVFLSWSCWFMTGRPLVLWLQSKVWSTYIWALTGLYKRSLWVVAMIITSYPALLLIVSVHLQSTSCISITQPSVSPCRHAVCPTKQSHIKPDFCFLPGLFDLPL